MGKLLFWIVIIIGALLIARIIAHSKAKQQPPQRPRRGADLPPKTMVRCAHCGIYLEASEAVQRKGYTFCTLAHSLRGRRS